MDERIIKPPAVKASSKVTIDVGIARTCIKGQERRAGNRSFVYPGYWNWSEYICWNLSKTADNLDRGEKKSAKKW